MGIYKKQRPPFQWSKYNLDELRVEYYQIWIWAFAEKYGVWKKWIYDNLGKMPSEVISKVRTNAQLKSAEARRNNLKIKDVDIIKEYKDKMNNLPLASEQPYYPWTKPFIKLPLTVWRLS